jgi:hypothetical protein
MAQHLARRDRMVLSSMVKRARCRWQRFSFVYNSIDHWVCDLRLEAIVLLDPRRVCPVCTGGKRAAPPENVSGSWWRNGSARAAWNRPWIR